MKLKSVKIHNYKCFKNNEEMIIDRKITCIVGKNESGKSAFLEALSTICPTDDNTDFKDIECHPNDVEYNEKNLLLSSFFELDELDITSIKTKFGVNLFSNNTISVTINYSKSKLLINLKDYITEKDFVIHYCKKLNIISMINTYQELLDLLKKEDIKNEIDKYSSYHDLISGTIYQILPFFPLFQENLYLPYRLSIDDLIEKKKNATLSFIEKLIINVLENKGKKLNDYKIINDDINYQKYNNYLDSVTNEINNKINEYWNGSVDFKLKINIQHSLEKYSPPFNSGNIILITAVSNGSLDKFILRSNGVKVFSTLIVILSFIGYIYNFNDFVILLDEPGLSLHGSAQEQLLKYMYDNLIEKNKWQVIYTTHSPFMVDKNQLESIRTFELNNEGNIKISNSVAKVNVDTLLPLENALGYKLKQGLFFGEHYIIVEGYSDLCYFNCINEVLEENDKLDRRWIIIPAHGNGNISVLYNFLINNGMNTVVVVDYNPQDKQPIDNLLKNFNGIKLLKFPEVIKKPYGNIEDLLGVNNLIHLLQKTINETIDKHLLEKLEKLSTSSELFGLIKNDTSIENKYKKDHDEIAKCLMEKGFNDIGFVDDRLIKENFKKLFELINAQLA